MLMGIQYRFGGCQMTGVAERFKGSNALRGLAGVSSTAPEMRGKARVGGASDVGNTPSDVVSRPKFGVVARSRLTARGSDDAH